MVTEHTDYFDTTANVLLKDHGVDYRVHQAKKSIFLKAITTKQSTLHISGQESVQWMRAFYSRGLCSYLRLGAIIFCGSVTPYVSLNLNKLNDSNLNIDCLTAIDGTSSIISENTLFFNELDALRVLDVLAKNVCVADSDYIEAQKLITAFFQRISMWSVDFSAIVDILGSPVVKVSLDYQVITGQEPSVALVNPNLKELGFEQVIPKDTASKLFATHALSHHHELQKKASK